MEEEHKTEKPKKPERRLIAIDKEDHEFLLAYVALHKAECPSIALLTRKLIADLRAKQAAQPAITTPTA